MARIHTNKKHRKNRVPADFKKWLADKWQKQPADMTLLKLNGRLGNRTVPEYALQVVSNNDAKNEQRIMMFNVLREFGDASCIDSLLPLLESDQQDWLQQTSMDVLSRYNDDRIFEILLRMYASHDSKSRTRIRRILFARKPSTKQFLAEIDKGTYNAGDVTLGELNRIASHSDKSINELIVKHWGQINKSNTQQKITEIRRVRFNLRIAGDLKRGKELFEKHCTTCHQLFGEGKKLGPDLTTANRKDLNYLLESIINPNAFVRKEFVSSMVITSDGRVQTGIIVNESSTQIVLADNKNEQSIIRREDIEELHNASTSLMPEDVLKPLKDQELRDLFSYLQSNGAIKH